MFNLFCCCVISSADILIVSFFFFFFSLELLLSVYACFFECLCT
jgi:hypothetical protein